MNYLLDTCVISEIIKPRPNMKVMDWLKNIPAENLYLSSITIGEIQKGLVKLPESNRKKRLENWFATLLKSYSERIYLFDIVVAKNWGKLQGKAEQKGTPMSTIDSLIAAIAYTHDLVIVTRNEKDFQGNVLKIINPWNDVLL